MLAHETQLFIVDNDPNGSARFIADSFRQCLPNIIYSVEAAPGVASARNALIALFLDSPSEWLSFLDDDQTVDSNWFTNISTFIESTTALAVGAPVLPQFETAPPVWMQQGNFYNRPRFNHGAVVRTFNTGNLTIHRRVLEHLSPFDSSFATGGEDTEFLSRFHARGLEEAWCDTALSYEWYPPGRVTLYWLIQRTYSSQLAWERITASEHPLKRNIKKLLKVIYYTIRQFPRFVTLVVHTPQIQLARIALDLARIAAILVSFVRNPNHQPSP